MSRILNSIGANCATTLFALRLSSWDFFWAALSSSFFNRFASRSASFAARWASFSAALSLVLPPLLLEEAPSPLASAVAR
eukprot:11953963-Alexandrium_andersonii.AAC.1